MALQIIASKKLSEEILGLDADDFDFADEIAKLHDALENPPKIPTTAAEIKRQYLLRDYGIQTDQTEILDMKHLQDLNEALVSDLHDLRYEASLTEKHIQIQQSKHIEAQVSKLNTQHHEQISRLKTEYSKRIDKIRRSTRQELADACASIKGEFMSWHELEVQKQMEDMESSSFSARRKTVAGGSGKDLGFGKAQLEIKKLTAEVESLRSELDEAINCKPEVIVDNSAVEAAAKEAKKLNQKIDLLEAQSEKARLEKNKLEKDLFKASQAMNDLKAENVGLENKLKELETSVREASKQLNIERLEAAKKLLEARETFEQKLQQRENELNDKIKAQQVETSDLRLKLEKLEKKLNAAGDAMKKANDNAKIAAENAKKLKKESELKASEKKDVKSEKVEPTLVDNSGFGQEAMGVINGLKKRLEHMERMFKKKEEVLMNQMHALKDEGFIRNQLERDALLLHKVDLRYANSNITRIPAHHLNSHLAPNPAVINELQHLIDFPQMKQDTNNVLPSIRPKTTPANAKLSNTRININTNNETDQQQKCDNIVEGDLDSSMPAFEIE